MELLNENLWMTEEDNIVTIGLTPELQDEAGDISYANIASLGNIDVDDTIINVEASKASIEIPSPIQGIVIECNENAEDIPSLFNSTVSKYNWIVSCRKINI